MNVIITLQEHMQTWLKELQQLRIDNIFLIEKPKDLKALANPLLMKQINVLIVSSKRCKELLLKLGQTVQDIAYNGEE